MNLLLPQNNFIVLIYIEEQYKNKSNFMLYFIPKAATYIRQMGWEDKSAREKKGENKEKQKEKSATDY